MDPRLGLEHMVELFKFLNEITGSASREMYHRSRLPKANCQSQLGNFNNIKISAFSATQQLLYALLNGLAF